jgi:hypothetical protein
MRSRARRVKTSERDDCRIELKASRKVSSKVKILRIRSKENWSDEVRDFLEEEDYSDR